MAGMRRWLVAVALGCLAVLGLVRLWSGGFRQVVFGPPPDSAAMVYFNLASEARGVAGAIQRIRWSRAIAEAGGAAGDSVVVLGSPVPVPDAFRDEVRRLRSRVAPAGSIAVAVVQSRWQRPEEDRLGIRYSESQGIDYLLPEAGPCQVALYVPGGATTPSVLDQLVEPDRLLGPCAWVARYGPPSPSVRAWLRHGWGRMAEASAPSPDRPVADPPADPGRATLARRQYGQLDRLETACRRGDPDACVVSVGSLGYGVVAREPATADASASPLLYSKGPMVRSSFGGVGAHLLADIEAEIGPDRFARVWNTDGPVDEALSEALGRPLGDWIADWAAARFPEPLPAGPSPGDVLLTLLAIAILAGIGLLAGAKGRPLTGL